MMLLALVGALGNMPAEPVERLAEWAQNTEACAPRKAGLVILSPGPALVA